MEHLLLADVAVFNELVETVQGFVPTLSHWLNTNKLVAQNKLMLFISQIHPILPDIRFNQNTLEWVSHIKYLGIVLDDILSFKLHIADVSRRCSRIRGVIYSVSSFINRESLTTLYYSLVYCHIKQSIYSYFRWCSWK